MVRVLPPSSTLEALQSFSQSVLDRDRYAENRQRYRAYAGQLKRTRRLCLGPDIELLFESHETVLLHLQEIIFVESLTRPASVWSLLKQYAPLLAGPGELTATLMLCRGASGAARALHESLDGERLCLNLGDHQATGRLIDREDHESPVRYLRFQRWKPGAPRLRDSLTLDIENLHLCTTIPQGLSYALHQERGPMNRARRAQDL